MTFVRIELENIGVFRGKKEFKLSKGLNILYAPNASGKTSLIAGLKAVAISALAPTELLRVLNDYEERGLIKLRINSAEYVVELNRKPDGSVEAWGTRITENGIIKKVAFIDLENDFVNAIYAGNEEYVKRILREVTGVSYIETILDILNGFLSEYEYSYETKKRDYEKRKEEITKQYKRVEERLDEVRERIREILRDPRIEPARKEIKEIRTKREGILKQIRDKRRQEIEINNRIGLLERDRDNKKAELEVLKEKRERLVREKIELEKKIIEIRRKIENLLSEIRNLEEQQNILKSEIREREEFLYRRKYVSEYAICPYCGAPVDRERIMKEIVETEENLSKLRDKLSEIRVEIERKRAEVEELKERGDKRLTSVGAELNKLAGRITELERYITLLEVKLGKEKKNRETIRDQIKELEDQLAILDRRLEKLRDKVPLIDELEHLQKEEQQLLEQLDYMLGLLRQLEQVYSEVRVLKERIEIVKLLLEYFKIRLNELKRIVIGKINEAILKHFKLLRLADLEYPILTEDFSLTLTRAGGISTTLAELSEAEKAILTILMSLALKDYVAEEFPFYVVDTLIEFIDDTRAREVLRYLMEISKSNKIIIVTKTKPYTGEPKILSQEDIIVNKIVI